METLSCSSCNKDKPITSFNKRSDKTKGKRRYDYRCKECKTLQRQQRVLADSAFKDQLKQNTRKWRLANEYGISEVEWFTMFTTQDGTCAVCQAKFTHPEQMKVDHNHTTGVVRELLCNNCNVGIGMLGEDITRLQNAIQYLTKHSIL